jgi:hypothetical protein
MLVKVPPSGSGTLAVSRGIEAREIFLFTGSIPTTMVASVRKSLSPPSTRTVNGRVERSPASEGDGLGEPVGDDEGEADVLGEAEADEEGVAGAAVGAGGDPQPARSTTIATVARRAAIGCDPACRTTRREYHSPRSMLRPIRLIARSIPSTPSLNAVEP